MTENRQNRLEAALGRYYAAQRPTPKEDNTNVLVSLMLAEDARARKAERSKLGTLRFTAAQVRYVPVWTWLAQVLIVALMVAMVQNAQNTTATKLSVGVFSAMSVLVGVPTVHASKRYGMAELEYSCARNAASVMLSRLVVMGCSSSLVVAAMVGVVSAGLDVSVFDVALWACPLFFGTCAGSLVLLRKAPPSSAAALCVVWGAGCSLALVAFAGALPDLYANASLATWATSAAVAFAWLSREVAMTLRTAAAGLDSFVPQPHLSH